MKRIAFLVVLLTGVFLAGRWIAQAQQASINVPRNLRCEVRVRWTEDDGKHWKEGWMSTPCYLPSESPNEKK